MMKFINYTNHPSDKWDDRQKSEAGKYGEIIDMLFPEVPADADEKMLRDMAERELSRIMRESSPEDTVLVMGEFSLSYLIINGLKASGYKVVCSAAHRRSIETIENGVTKKISEFEFERFREYGK